MFGNRLNVYVATVVFGGAAMIVAGVAGCYSTPSGNGISQVASSAKPVEPPRIRYTLSTAGLPSDGMWKCDPKLVDIDTDGLLDLAAVPRLGSGPRVWRSTPTGSWHEMSQGLVTGETSCGGGVAIGDADGDGSLDLLVADHCNGVAVYLATASHTWKPVVDRLYPKDLVPPDAMEADYVGAEGIDVGDVNGDTHLDLAVISNDAAGVNVYFGDGTGNTWTKSSTGLLTRGAGNRVRLADINGDGILDLIAAHCDGPRVWLNDGSGNWAAASTGLPTPALGCLYRGTDIADVNEDGLLDIAMANWVDGPDVFYQQSDGSWLEAPDVFPAMLGGAVGLALGDLDSDGHVDMVVSGRLPYEVGMVYGVFALYGDGAGNWHHDAASGLPSTGLPFTWGVGLGDVNQDGLLDIVAGSGGNVATNVKRATRSLEENLLVWYSQVPRQPQN